MTSREYLKQGINVSELARKNGIRPVTAFNRIYAGWKLEDAVSHRPAPMYRGGFERTWKSKSDVEMEINEIPMDKLPKQVQKMLPADRSLIKKAGAWIRRHKLKQFDEYYYANFVPKEHLEAVKRNNSAHSSEARSVAAKKGLAQSRLQEAF